MTSPIVGDSAGAGNAPLAILHCHSTFSLGGKEARACRLMNAFGDAARHTILSAVPDALQARDAIDPSINVAFPGEEGAPSLRGKPSAGRYRQLARYMRQFDLVLTYNWGAMDAVGARRLFRRDGPPLIHHEDGFNADEGRRRTWKRDLYRRLMLPTVHRLIVPSHTLERLARARWGTDLPLRRISNGIDVARYAGHGDAAVLPGFVRSPDDVVVGTIAGLRAVKDLPLLVRTLALTPPNVRLVIAGDGPERATIEAEAARCGVSDRVHMAGFIADPSRIAPLFDIMALSSLSEQQPISVMEGMAAGLPVVAPPVGDVADMVATANAPFIVERTETALAAALTQLAQDPALRQAVGAENRALASREYDEAAMIAAYRATYAEAMGILPSRLDPGLRREE